MLLWERKESLTEAKVRFYKQMKIKTFQFVPPDEESMLQTIKLIHYEVYYWSRVAEAIISDILFQDNV